jgi:YihY family inner membrane protein
VRRVPGARTAVARFWKKALDDNLTGLAAMVAYNLLLSIFPLALIALFVAGRILQSTDLQESVLNDLRGLFPSAAESTLSSAVRRLESTSTTVGIVAFVAAIWVGASFWGALDTAFCRIYDCPCRTWVQQKLFSLAMLGVVLLFVAASVAVPTVQSLLLSETRDLPFGLSEVSGLGYAIIFVLGVVGLFGALCLTYALVPKGRMPWRAVWPGAVGATLAIGLVDWAFPLYLENISSLRAGTTFVFILIVLVWFYALALILLAGAVVNELRFERIRGMPDPETNELSTDQLEREAIERERARHANEPAEEHAHERRAERAAYLREKLEERARSEDEA